MDLKRAIALRSLAQLVEGKNHVTKSTLRYLAGVIEGRGKIGYLTVSLRMDGRIPIPKILHTIYGGTFLYQTVARGRRGWIRVQGKRAEALLSDLEPYLVFEQRRVRRLLELWKSRKVRG